MYVHLLEFSSKALDGEGLVMKKILWTIFLFLVMSDNVLADEDYLSSVAQVRVTNYSYSIDHPWQKGSAGKTSGSAVLISGNRLLTNAHVVESAVRVELRRVGSDRWYPAFIEHVSEASDLAMLRAAEKDFYIDATPARLATDISPGASVLVVGFPDGLKNVGSVVLFQPEILLHNCVYHRNRQER